MQDIVIKVNPSISEDELYQFYVKNDICEKGYPKEVAARVLGHSSLIVGMYMDGELAGFSRAMFDGLSGVIVEFCLALQLQGPDLEYDNGSIIEKDRFGYGKELGKTVVSELLKMGAFFISATVFDESEGSFFKIIGFKKNHGHYEYIIDKRPYV